MLLSLFTFNANNIERRSVTPLKKDNKALPKYSQKIAYTCLKFIYPNEIENEPFANPTPDKQS